MAKMRTDWWDDYRHRHATMLDAHRRKNMKRPEKDDTTMASASAPLIEKAKFLLNEVSKLHSLCEKLDDIQSYRTIGTLTVNITARQHIIKTNDAEIIDKFIEKMKAEITDRYKTVTETAADICGKKL